MHRRSTFPVPDAGWLVRYRFRAPKDLYRHLQLGNGFLVQERVPRHRVARAIVEVAFAEGASTLLLHGHVGHAAGNGALIEVPLPRTAVRWMGEGDGPRRGQKRTACDLLVEVKPHGAEPWLCRALDVSSGGLRLAAGGIELGVAGDAMELALISPDGRVQPVAAAARLAWAGMREAGVQLVSAGPRLAELLESIEARWAAVPLIEHDATCNCGQQNQRAS